jgi:heterodisulfide reductase subunit B
VALPARNLAIAQREGLPELLAPCPMCSVALMKARGALADSAELRRQMSEIVELDVHGDTQVLNLIQVLQKIGLEKIKEKAARPLAEFRPACYYGCLLTRPAATLQFDDAEQPGSMETILRELGAQPVEWSYKTECCGGGMTMADEETVLELSHKILGNAIDHGANCLVVACPMCHVNLDMKQAGVERRYDCLHDLVVYYLSDLVGLALGLDEHTLGIDRHFVVKR